METRIADDIFYPKLIQALIDSHFRFSTHGFSKDDITKDHDKLSSALRLILKFTPTIINAVGNVGVWKGAFKLHPIFDQEGVQKKVDKIREYASLVCFKYLLNQPIVIAVIDADQFTQDEFINIASTFDETITGMLEFTGKIGGIHLGKYNFGGTTLSSTGIMLLTFFDHASALRFVETTQEKCKIFHFWKKTWVLPWVIDVSAKELRRHSGLPIIVPQILNVSELNNAIFDS